MGVGSVLIVGASRGIGLELARQYAAAGWTTHATVRQPAPSGTFHEGTTVHALDVTNGAQIAALAAAFEAGEIDVLIHNAGIKGDRLPRAEVVAVNVDAPFAVIDALRPAVRRSSMRKIMLVSSQLGSRERFGGGRMPADNYGYSKCLLNDRYRAAESGWRAEGLASAIVHPGWVRTDMGGASAPTSVEASARGLRAVVADLMLTNSGRFLTFEGRVHPW
mmetsp:Transcript_34485/g.80789  ORF Transcript_34485/g.80789 Transcript_34485/m.80789 type:complete len:220 (-) Transcript_34485:255-914(-)